MRYALLSSAAFGGLFLFILLAVCFALVHIARLALLGWKYKSSPSNVSKPTPKKDPTPSPTPPEPVYYIVERKKRPRRPKTEYTEPKEIRFK